jgi:hypothetical protein
VRERVQIQLPRRPHRHRTRGALVLLIASVIAGAIAYHVSGGGAFSAWEPARASAFEHNQQKLR